MKSRDQKSSSLPVFIPVLLTVFFIIAGCSNPCAHLTRLINTAINDSKVTIEEWNNLTSFIEASQREIGRCHNEIFSEGKLNESALRDLIAKTARDNKISGLTFWDQRSTLQPVIKIFLDNTGSMNGFVSTDTKFESAVMKLITDLDFHFKNKSLNYISMATYPADKTIEDFVSTMSPEGIASKGSIKERGSTDLNHMISEVLNKINKGQICVFISDCQKSIQTANPDNVLNQEKNLVKLAFQEKIKNFPIATYIIKLISNFDGYYYYWDPTIRKESGTVLKSGRAYYIWIIGDIDSMNVLLDKMDFNYFDHLDGYSNSYLFLYKESDHTPYYTILDQTNKIGEFRIDHDASVNECDKGIKEANPNHRNNQYKNIFQFSIAVDLSKFFGEKSYLLEPAHYDLKSEDPFTVSVAEFSASNVDQNDKIKIRNRKITHIITLTTNKLRVPNQRAEVTLKNLLPAWVEQSNLLLDNEALEHPDKTFGLSYLVHGVSEAYKNAYPQITSYHTITVQIKK